MTMILVTHEIGFARKVSDRVVFMHHGMIGISAPKNFFIIRNRELATFLQSVI